MANNRMMFRNDTGSPVSDAKDPALAALDAQMWPIITGGNVGTGVVNGGLVTGTTDMHVQVGAATLALLNTTVSTVAVLKAIAAADDLWRRFDLVVYRAGSIQVVTGVADPVPCFPPVQYDGDGEISDVVLAAVLVQPKALLIEDDDIVMLGVPPSSGLGGGGKSGKAAKFQPLRLDNGNHISSYNGNVYGAHMAIYCQDNCVTAPNGDVYVAYVTPLKSVGIARIKKDAPNAEVFDLGDLPGNPFETGSTWSHDLHDVMSLGLSPDGYLHVVGNVHAQTLKYAYVPVANLTDAASWNYGTTNAGTDSTKYLGMVNNFVGDFTEKQTLTPAQYGVTYPTFITLSSGQLVFAYRYGQSGSGDMYINRWDSVGHQWHRAGHIVDGFASTTASQTWSVYPWKFIPGLNNDAHFYFDWRQDTDPSSNEGMYYLHLKNLLTTVTAETAGGTAIGLPIQYKTVAGSSGSNAELIPVGPATYPGGHWASGTHGFPPTSLINNGGGCVDPSNNPHCIVQYSSPALDYHVWHDSTGWHYELITDPDDRFAAGRNAIIATPDGRIWMVCTDHTGIVFWHITPGESNRDHFYVAMFEWTGEVVFDTRALLEHGLFRMLIVGANSQLDYGDDDLPGTSGPAAGSFPSDAPTTPFAHFGSSLSLENPRAIVGVLTVDLTQIDSFMKGLVRLPGIYMVDNAWYSDRYPSPPLTPTKGWYAAGAGSSSSDGSSVPRRQGTTGAGIAIYPKGHNRVLFARLRAAIGPVASGQWFAMCINAILYGDTTTGGLGSTAGKRICPLWAGDDRDTNYMAQTSWVRLADFEDGDFGLIRAEVWPNGGSGGQVQACTVELGELFCG